MDCKCADKCIVQGYKGNAEVDTRYTIYMHALFSDIDFKDFMLSC